MAGVSYEFIRTITTEELSIPPVASSQDQFNRDTSSAFNAMAGGYGNAGDLKRRASAVAVPLHLLCDGQAISRIDYAELFAVIGTSWGAGDGSSTFNLPTQADLAAQVVTPPATPTQIITSTSVTSGTTVTNPSGTGQAGGTMGGAVDSGGRGKDIS